MKRAIWGREQGVALRWIGAAILALAVACAGCSALLPKLETPRLSLVGVKLQDMTYFEQRLLVRLLVKNPNDMALPIKGINVSFQLAGEDFAEGVSARAFEVPAFGEAEFDMIVTANAATALLHILERNRGKQPDSLDYRIRGQLKTGIRFLGSVPFDEKGKVALDSLTGKDQGKGRDKDKDKDKSRGAGSGDTRS